MKKCTYCGKEYPDEAEVCAIDQEPLEKTGLTFRERLTAANLMDDFDVAARKEDESQMLALLTRIGIKRRTAVFTVARVIALSRKNGY